MQGILSTGRQTQETKYAKYLEYDMAQMRHDQSDFNNSNAQLVQVFAAINK